MSTSDSYAVCAAVRQEGDRFEAHVFSAKEPAERFKELIRAARAAASGNPYREDEYGPSSKWLSGLLQAGKLDEVRLVVLQEDIPGHNAAKLVKIQAMDDLRELGFTFPTVPRDDRDTRLEGIRTKLEEAGLTPDGAATRALKSLAHECRTTGGQDGPWTRASIRFGHKGPLHAQVMALVRDLLHCCGYLLHCEWEADGSMSLFIATGELSEGSDGRITVDFGISDTRSDFEFEAIRCASFLKHEALVLMSAASVRTLLEQSLPAIVEAVSADVQLNREALCKVFDYGDPPDVLHGAPPAVVADSSPRSSFAFLIPGEHYRNDLEEPSKRTMDGLTFLRWAAQSLHAHYGSRPIRHSDYWPPRRKGSGAEHDQNRQPRPEATLAAG
jgi:hypothetical protein